MLVSGAILTVRNWASWSDRPFIPASNSPCRNKMQLKFMLMCKQSIDFKGSMSWNWRYKFIYLSFIFLLLLLVSVLLESSFCNQSHVTALIFQVLFVLSVLLESMF